MIDTLRLSPSWTQFERSPYFHPDQNAVVTKQFGGWSTTMELPVQSTLVGEAHAMETRTMASTSSSGTEESDVTFDGDVHPSPTQSQEDLPTNVSANEPCDKETEGTSLAVPDVALPVEDTSSAIVLTSSQDAMGATCSTMTVLPSEDSNDSPSGDVPGAEKEPSSPICEASPKPKADVTVGMEDASSNGTTKKSPLPKPKGAMDSLLYQSTACDRKPRNDVSKDLEVEDTTQTEDEYSEGEFCEEDDDTTTIYSTSCASSSVRFRQRPRGRLSTQRRQRGSKKQQQQQKCQLNLPLAFEDLRDFASESANLAAGAWENIQKFLHQTLNEKDVECGGIGSQQPQIGRADMSIADKVKEISVPPPILPSQEPPLLESCLADSLTLETAMEDMIAMPDDSLPSRADDMSSLTEPAYIHPKRLSRLLELSHPTSKQKSSSGVVQETAGKSFIDNDLLLEEGSVEIADSDQVKNNDDTKELSGQFIPSDYVSNPAENSMATPRFRIFPTDAASPSSPSTTPADLLLSGQTEEAPSTPTNRIHLVWGRHVQKPTSMNPMAQAAMETSSLESESC